MTVNHRSGLSFTELIELRKSCRSFSGRPLGMNQKELLDSFMASQAEPPFGSRTRFYLVESGVEGLKTVPGTYGVIKGATHFIVGAVNKGGANMEDFGYQFEKIILFATGLHLATCWVGGTFSRSSYADLIGLTSNEVLPAVCPVGYPLETPTFRDRLMRASVGSAKRKEWKELFFSKDFRTPIDADRAGVYGRPLEMIRLAPSAVNKQPWRVVVADDRVYFFLRRAPGYRKLFPAADLQRIDMGIAMCHFDLAMREEGIEGRWEKGPAAVDAVPPRAEYCATWVRS